MELTAEFKAGTNYIINPVNAHRIGVQVVGTGLTPDSDGRLILPNGSPLGGAVNALLTRDAQLALGDDTNVQGLLWQPEGLEFSSVTEVKNATMFVRGVADINQLPATVDADVQGALPLIQFQRGR
jgi:hypothetical protein